MKKTQGAEERIRRFSAALGENPLTQEMTNQMTVVLLNEIAARLEAIENKLDQTISDQNEMHIGG